jgi:hypothetical protein
VIVRKKEIEKELVMKTKVERVSFDWSDHRSFDKGGGIAEEKRRKPIE